MDNKGDFEKGDTSNRWLTGIIVFLVLYFLFPATLILPIVKLQKHGMLPHQSLQLLVVIFTPVGWLSERVPPYRKLLKMEEDFIRRFLPADFL
jgi:hypothetical protein